MSTTLTADDIELTIDEEFAGLVPRHTESEAEEFRKSVEAEGRFHYPILYWIHKGLNIIVDGRHRYELWCELPPGTPIPPPKVEEVFYPDREAVNRAIIRSRLARASLDARTRKLLIGRLYNAATSDSILNLENVEKPAESSKGQNGPSTEVNVDSTTENDASAADRIAEETGTPARTVKRYGELAAALDNIGSVNSKAKSDIESGTIKVKDSDVIAIGKLNKTQISKALKNIRTGEDWTTGLDVPKPQRTKPPKKSKPRKSKKPTPLKELDTAVGAVSRALVQAGKAHGEGPQYKTIFAAVTEIKKAIAEWGKA